MYELIFLFCLGLIWLIFATAEDIKKREVSNWLNFSLIIFALAFRFFFSLFNEDFMFFYQGLFGLVVFFVLGNLFYYLKMFGGGDYKLMLALGTILPFSDKFMENSKALFYFLGIFLFVGAVYGLFAILYLGIKNFKKIKKELLIQYENSKMVLWAVVFLGFVVLLFGFFNEIFFYFGILILFIPDLYLFAKSIDEVCMVKKVNVKDLSPGDLLYKEIKIKDKEIKVSWDGLTENDIKLLKKNKRFVWLRYGIAFVPVFLITYLLFLGLWWVGILYSLI